MFDGILRSSFLFVALTTGMLGLGQHQDCADPMIFTDSLGEVVLSEGSGNTLDISGYSIKNEHFFTKEHNTFWCMIVFTQDADFQFQIVPKYSDDDFDFIVFNYHGAATCDSISKRILKPIRSNLSKRTPDMGSVTGLQEGYENFYAAAGPNPSFSKPISVLEGDTLLLVFDSPYGSKGGFSIMNTTTYYPKVVELEIIEVPQVREKRVTLHILDANGDVIPNPSIFVQSLSREHRENPQIDEDGNIYSEFFKAGVQQIVIASQRGYLFQKFNFKWNGEKDSIVELVLTPLKKGSKLQMENILFLPNSPQFLSSSRGDLNDIVLFMKNNPTMEIEVGGHVHGAKKNNKPKYRKLSDDRALAVYNYLVQNGVEENRMTYHGYGNSEMIYRPAKNESQIAANRRVEITITKVE